MHGYKWPINFTRTRTEIWAEGMEDWIAYSVAVERGLVLPLQPGEDDNDGDGDSDPNYGSGNDGEENEYVLYLDNDGEEQQATVDDVVKLVANGELAATTMVAHKQSKWKTLREDKQWESLAGGSDSASKIARGVQHSSAGRWEAAERQRLQKLHQLQNKREELANVRRHLKEAIARGDSLEEVKVLQGSVARLEGEMFQLESELAEIESALEKIVALIRSMFGETAAHIFTDTRSRAMRIAGTDVKRLLSGEMTDADEMQAVVERNPELISLIKTSVSSFLEGPFLSQVDVPDIVMHKVLFCSLSVNEVLAVLSYANCARITNHRSGAGSR